LFILRKFLQRNRAEHVLAKTLEKQPTACIQYGFTYYISSALYNKDFNMVTISDVDIERIITLLKKHNLQKISLQEGDQRICIAAHTHAPTDSQMRAQQPLAQKHASVENITTLPTITAPTVGTLYRAPAPDKPVFVQVGDHVKRGQTVCILEAMKTFNHIKSPIDGKIVEVCAENGQTVDFGQRLFTLEPLHS
jgi:acetyl-CoA carboxylase biotin carboxyl carrier protein